MGKKLNYGMVGGSLDAFIGDVHRKAIAVNENAQLVAGCFSSNAEKNMLCGEHYQLDSDRIYTNYKEMAEKESAREDGIDFVCITTPNNTHYEMAKCFLEKGIHVSCEKPLCFTIEEAKELEKLAKEKGLLFCVTYTYTGYNMVKQARELVMSGEIGEIVNIHCEYLQDWMINALEEGATANTKIAVWRADPTKSGISDCVGDIGTHIESMVSYITGLHVKKVAAVLDTYGHELDLNANILVEMDNGCHGVFSCSQVCAGHANGFVVKIFGKNGSIEWHQEAPDQLLVKKKNQPIQIYNRGYAYNGGRADELNRIPCGHPEGLTIAFANIYQAFTNALIKTAEGEALTDSDMDYPSIEYGIRGMEFVTAVVKSSQNGSAWTEV